jgi:NADH-quinone oxidoreductase subunit G
MVPRENEAINETWIADRDRFGFEGMYSGERVTAPLMRVNGALQEVDWEVALTAAAEGLQKTIAEHGAASAGFLSSPTATVEEMYLLARIARGLGCGNIDHRLRQLDFRAQATEGAYPNLGMPIADVEKLEGVLIIGANLRHEMPMLAHRIRKAAVKGGAKVAFLNPRVFEYLFPVAAYGLAARDLVGDLTAVVHAAAAAANKPVPAGLKGATVTDDHRSVASVLAAGTRRAVMLGHLAQRHPAYSELKWLAGLLASLTGARLALMTEGPNAAGAYLAGAVPHREPGGKPARSPGLAARAMLDSALKAYVLFGGIDPAQDLGAGTDGLRAAELVVAATTHLSASLREVAHIVLPIGSFAESAGTYVNLEGRWQSWAGAAKLVGDSRPGWKVLRVLANLLAVPGVDYISSEEIRESLRSVCGEGLTEPLAGAGAVGGGAAVEGGVVGGGTVNGEAAPGPWVDIPPYQVDVLVRGSEALGKTKDGRLARDVI